MEKIKQFTIRFHMKNPKEEEALQFLQSKSEILGISQNAFLMKLITDAIEEPVESEFDMDKMTTAIVNGVEKKLLNLVATMTKNADRENYKAEPDIKSEEDKVGLEDVISEDAMDFLNMF